MRSERMDYQSCVPISVFLAYKMFPSVVYAFQSTAFYIFLGSLSSLTLLTTLQCAVIASYPNGTYDGVMGMINEQIDDLFF
uniref:Aa_trans domain-containing protein n=1 Tax=Caenorhabditis tropicalis TaxID=1561998 RepID=A0A1I7TIE2_9PELO